MCYLNLLVLSDLYSTLYNCLGYYEYYSPNMTNSFNLTARGPKSNFILAWSTHFRINKLLRHTAFTAVVDFFSQTPCYQEFSRILNMQFAV